MGIEEQDQQWMAHALNLACRAEEEGEVPIGAVVVKDGVVIGEGWNRPIALHDPTAHAEVQAIRAAAIKQCNYRLPGSTLYVTLDPCTMCAGALFWSQMGALVIGARDSKRGFSLLKPAPLHPKTKVSFGMLEADCEAKIKDFFKKMRDKQKER